MKILLDDTAQTQVRVALVSIVYSNLPEEGRMTYLTFENHSLVPSWYLNSIVSGLHELIHCLAATNSAEHKTQTIRLHLVNKPMGRFVAILPFISSTCDNGKFESFKRVQSATSFDYQLLSDKQLKRCLRQSYVTISIDPDKFTDEFYKKYGFVITRFQLHYLLDRIRESYEEIRLDLPEFVGDHMIGKDLLGRDVSVVNADRIVIAGKLELLPHFGEDGIVVTEDPDQIKVSHKTYNAEEVGINLLQLYVNNNEMLIDFLKAMSPLHNVHRLVEIVQRTLDHIYTTTEPEMWLGLSVQNLFIDDAHDLMEGLVFKQDFEKLRQALQHVFSLDCLNTSSTHILSEPGLRVVNVKGLDVIHQTAIAVLFGILRKYDKYSGQFITDVFDRTYNPRSDGQFLSQMLGLINLRKYILFVSKITTNTMNRIPKDLLLIDTRNITLDLTISRMLGIDNWTDHISQSLVLQSSNQGTTLLQPEIYPEVMEDESIAELAMEYYPPKETEGTGDDREEKEPEDTYDEGGIDEDFDQRIPQYYLIPILVCLLDVGKKSSREEIELEIFSDMKIDNFIEHLLDLQYLDTNSSDSTYELTPAGRSRIYDLQKVARQVELEPADDNISAYVEIQKKVLMVKDREMADMLIKMLYVKAKKIEPILLEHTDYPKSQPVSSRVLGVYADFLEGIELDVVKQYVKQITVLVDDLSRTEEDFEETHDILDMADMEDKDVDFEAVVDNVTTDDLMDRHGEEIVSKVMEEISGPGSGETDEIATAEYGDIGVFIPTPDFGEMITKGLIHPLADPSHHMSLQDIYLHFLLNRQDQIDQIRLDHLLRRHHLDQVQVKKLMELGILDDEYQLLVSPSQYPLVPSASIRLNQVKYEKVPENLDAEFIGLQSNRQFLIALLEKLNLPDHVFLVHAIQAILYQRYLRAEEIDYVNKVLGNILRSLSNLMKSKSEGKSEQKRRPSTTGKVSKPGAVAPPKPKIKTDSVTRSDNHERDEETQSVFTLKKTQIPGKKAEPKPAKTDVDYENAYLSSENVDELEKHLLGYLKNKPQEIMVQFFHFILRHEGIEPDTDDLQKLIDLFSEVGSKSSTNITQFTSNLSEIVKSYEELREEREYVNKQLISKIIQRMRIFSVTDEFSDLLNNELNTDD